MIHANISNLYTLLSFHSKVSSLIAQLLNENIERSFNRKQLVDYGEIKVIINNYLTQPLPKLKSELHQFTYDVHFIVRGEESIAYRLAENNPELISKVDPENDVVLFRSWKRYKEAKMSTGDILFVPPNIQHAAGAHYGNIPVNVDKIVIKIPYEVIEEITNFNGELNNNDPELQKYLQCKEIKYLD